ncbi:MAG TPA: histidine kinase [Pseudonocardia sp.]|nr:histidine kinase [Pseudonocardia sp.]
MEASNLPDPSTHPIRPMLATEAAMPAGSAWAFEFVWDGLRAVTYLRPGRARLLSGTDRPITSSYPELAALAALAEAHGPMALDGKIVALDQLGRPNVMPLRQRMSNSRPSAALLRRTPVMFYLLDVLYLHGRSTLELPYRQRRELLAELDLSGLPAELPPYFLDTDGQTVLHAAERHGLAGVVAKRLDSRYQPGRRSRAWVETLPRHTQRVVVGGWQPGGRSSNGAADPGAEAAGGSDRVGALLVGVPGPAGLRYVGRINIGLDAAARRELAGRLDALAEQDCPFAAPRPADLRSARWLAPRLVGEISYRRWEMDGQLRNASWLGLCADVHPASVRGPVVLTAAPDAGLPPPGAIGATPAAAPAAELAALDEAVRLAQAEVRALRAQISPHFVYNALTTIASYVRTDPNRARELLLEFAEYTRYSFRAAAESTTLGDELANADRYLALESARFGDRLQVKRDVAEELLDVVLPFLTVQQLVENAVRYGIEGTPRGGTVTITAARVGVDCVLTVSDDGLGMDPARLTDAVTDVRERLRAAPGPAAALEVDTVPEAGTTITLRLPVS